MTYAVFDYFDTVVVLLAITANCIVLAAIIRSDLLLPGYRLFLISLSAGDLYMCFVNVLSLAYQISSQSIAASTSLDGPFILKCTAHVLRSLKLSAYFINLLNLCGMSMDNFIGVVYPMKYHIVMTRRTRFAIVIIWLFSISVAFMDVPVSFMLHQLRIADPASLQPEGEQLLANQRIDVPINNNVSSFAQPAIEFHDILKDLEPQDSALLIQEFFNNTEVLAEPPKKFVPSNKTKESLNRMLLQLHQEDTERTQQRTQNICAFLYYNDSKIWLEFAVIGLTVVCFLSLIICYSIIFRKVSNRLIFIAPTSDYRASSKLIITTVIFIGAFSICWLPFMISEVVMLMILQNNSTTSAHFDSFILIGQIVSSLLMLYPLIDPILYAVRVSAIQRALITLLLMVPCCRRYSSKLSRFRGSVSVQGTPRACKKTSVLG